MLGCCNRLSPPEEIVPVSKAKVKTAPTSMSQKALTITYHRICQLSKASLCRLGVLCIFAQKTPYYTHTSA